MNTKTIPIEGAQPEKTATLPSKQHEVSEAVVATSPVNVNSADKPESIAQKDYTPIDPFVSTEQAINATAGEEMIRSVSTSDVDLDTFSIYQDFAQMVSVKGESVAPSIEPDLGYTASDRTTNLITE